MTRNNILDILFELSEIYDLVCGIHDTKLRLQLKHTLIQAVTILGKWEVHQQN